MGSQPTTGLLVVLLSVAMGGQLAWAASGEAQLGVDERNRPCGLNFGFAFYTADGSTTDTCTTLDSSGNHTLVVTDGVASPEIAEPVLKESMSGDTITFSGRTGDCYYMVSGGNGSAASGGGAPQWTSDFDSSTSPHFVVYINDRYNSSDDVFTYGNISTVSIELANPADSNPVSFRLSQQSPNNGNGKVDILQDDGATPEPLGSDGQTERVYTITPDFTEPNGPRVTVQVMGLDPGDVIIIATDANP
jgi:hypothetical protein